MNPGMSPQFQIPDSQVGNLLCAGTRVIQEKQKRVVAGSMPPTRWKALEVISFQVARLRRLYSFHGYGSDLLANREHLGHPRGEIIEEGMQDCQTMVSGPDMVVTLLFEVLEEALQTVEGQVFNPESSDLPSSDRSHEQEECAQHVAIGADGGWEKPLLGTQVVEEE